ncbi:MAG: hypothetical protein IPH74_00355 [Bacteroidetes bacterium]|nr:hypothetical protein [Bacteroidota bacterium]
MPNYKDNAVEVDLSKLKETEKDTIVDKIGNESIKHKERIGCNVNVYRMSFVFVNMDFQLKALKNLIIHNNGFQKQTVL